MLRDRLPKAVYLDLANFALAAEPSHALGQALVREAALIKKHHPVANAEGKDDSTFLYAIITREEIPRVLTLRGKDIDFKNRKPRFDLKSESSRSNLGFRAIYGPFPSGAQLQEGLRLIRRIFPFFDTPRPIEFNTHIQHYPRIFNAKEYRHTIRHIMLFLSGRGKQLRFALEKEMQQAAREERFEDAAEARRELFALNHIQDVSLIKDENLQSSRPSGRIEAYDTAHLAGTDAIGVMTVVENGAPNKKEYRTFRIRGTMKDLRGPSSNERPRRSLMHNDDIASLKEILSRRLTHSEWPFPKVIVVDGGKAQKKAAESAIVAAGFSIPVVAVVKDEKHHPREIIGARRAGISEADAVLANAEAHRFSLARHRRARSRI